MVSLTKLPELWGLSQILSNLPLPHQGLGSGRAKGAEAPRKGFPSFQNSTCPTLGSSVNAPLLSLAGKMQSWKMFPSLA